MSSVTRAASHAFLEDLFSRAVATAHPAQSLPGHCPPPPPGRLIVLAAGKAAGSMAETVEGHYREAGLPIARIAGLAVARHGYGRPTRLIRMVHAGHPIPDAAGLDAAADTLTLAESAGPDDLVLALVSGGASANWIAPVAGVSLAEKQALTRALLRCGATIGEINTVRRHISRIKGGWLAARAYPAALVTLAISDVPGDDPAAIGSGPTVPDASTLDDARAVIARYRLALPDSISRALSNPANETPKASHPAFAGTAFALIARPADSLRAAEVAARSAGCDTILLGDRLEGEARDVAAGHARLAVGLRQQGRRTAILSGGELTVTLRGKGRGGPNQEYALALAIALQGIPGIAAIAADTDGTDGGTGNAEDPAGAVIDAGTLGTAQALGLDPAVFLADNNSTGFFERIGGLVRCGPTYTNVNDFRAILVDTP